MTTPGQLLRCGEPAPDLCLPGLDGEPTCLADLLGRIVVVNFWSAECPWSERADAELRADLQAWGTAVALLPIAANRNEGIDLLRGEAQRRGLPRLLLDAAGEVAARYGAQTTPHLFVVDEHGLLRYQGAFDDVTFRRRTPTRAYLREAVQALLAGQEPDPCQTHPYGCTIVQYDE